MARFRGHIVPWGDKHDDNDYKNIRQGAGEDAFWDEDELVTFPSQTKKKKHKRHQGCPGNDNGAHVYVWTLDENDWWRHYFPNEKREAKMCAGCGKRKNGVPLRVIK